MSVVVKPAWTVVRENGWSVMGSSSDRELAHKQARALAQKEPGTTFVVMAIESAYHAQIPVAVMVELPQSPLADPKAPKRRAKA